VSFDDNRRGRQTFDRINRLVSMVLLNTAATEGETPKRKRGRLSLSLSLSNARRSISPEQRNGGIAVAEPGAR